MDYARQKNKENDIAGNGRDDTERHWTMFYRFKLYTVIDKSALDTSTIEL